jgi:hypothetical protein
LLVGSNQSCFAESKSLIDAGRDLYRTATRPDGSTLLALVQSDVALPGTAAACVNCHRQSGIGISEGGSRSLNLTAPALFTATSKPPLRPAYDDALLVRAIVAGFAADGRSLNTTMPRYQLSADDAAALLAYLHSLGAAAPVGVTATDMHIATIVAEKAPPQERAAVEAVVQRYIDLKDNESRRDSARAKAAERHFYGRSSQRAYRNWKLHVWSLRGPASSWPEQLESLYEETRPFVILSGTAGTDWPTVHRFCEQREIPCVLPLSNVPPAGESDFYSMYFSAGAVLEAEVTANAIANSDMPVDSKVLVIYPEDNVGKAAYSALQGYLKDRDFKNISSFGLHANQTLSARKWQALLKSERPDVLVGWVPAEVIADITTRSRDSTILPDRIYTAESFADWRNVSQPDVRLQQRVRHIYPYSLPVDGSAQFPREYLWLKQQGFSGLDPASAARVLFSCRILGMGLSNIQSNFSREYLLEALEHALDGTQLSSVYPVTSLGPNQRILTHGAYVVSLSGNAENIFVILEWIRP